MSGLQTQRLPIQVFADEVPGVTITRATDVKSTEGDAVVRVQHVGGEVDAERLEGARRCALAVEQGETDAELVFEDAGFSHKKLTPDAKGTVNLRELGLVPDYAFTSFRVKAANGELVTTDGQSDEPIDVALTGGDTVTLTGGQIAEAVHRTLLAEGQGSKDWALDRGF